MQQVEVLDNQVSRSSRRHHLNTRTFPLLRMAGLAMLGLLALLHQHLSPDIPVNATKLGMGLLLYGILGWAFLRYGFSEEGWRQHLATVLFLTDIPIFVQS